MQSRHWTRWTPEMDAALRKHYPSGGSREVIAALGGIVKNKQVQQRARMLGLSTVMKGGRYAPEFRWTPEQDEVLYSIYPLGGAEACLQELPMRTRRAIRQRAWELGIGAYETGSPILTPKFDDGPLREAMRGLDGLTRARLSGESADLLRQLGHNPA